MDLITALCLLVVGAFGPSLMYLWWVRNKEQFDREPLSTISATFLWGVFFAVIISLVLEIWILNKFVRFSLDVDLISSIAVAPIIEEFAKVFGVLLVVRSVAFNEVDDGAVYGVASALGFAATENLLYEFSALISGGLLKWAVLTALRAVASTLMHAASTGISGYTIGMAVVGGRSAVFVVFGLILAMLLHAIYNFLASLGMLFYAVGFAIICFLIVVSRIR